MKVKELIEYLSKCTPDYEVINDYEESIGTVVEQTDLTDPNNCHVRLSI